MAHEVVRFPVGGTGSVTATPPRVTVTNRSGRVFVFADARGDIEVEGARRAVLEPDEVGERVLAEATHEQIIVRCPPGTDIVVGTLSGRVELHGSFGEVRATTSSGRIEVGDAASVDVRTRSGRIQVGRCAGMVRARSASARVTVDAATVLDATTASGAIFGGSVRDATVQSTSGRVELALDGAGSVAARTVSGRVRLSLPAGVRPELRLRSVSGRIEVPTDAPVGSGDERGDASGGASGNATVVAVETVSGRIRVDYR